MPIRNTCVARGLNSDTALHVVYTVPASSAFILKFLGLYSYGNVCSPTVYITAPTVVAFPLEVPTMAAPWTQSWTGWTVLNAGDTIGIQNSAAVQLGYWIAGAVLPYASP